MTIPRSRAESGASVLVALSEDQPKTRGELARETGLTGSQVRTGIDYIRSEYGDRVIVTEFRGTRSTYQIAIDKIQVSNYAADCAQRWQTGIDNIITQMQRARVVIRNGRADDLDRAIAALGSAVQFVAFVQKAPRPEPAEVTA